MNQYRRSWTRKGLAGPGRENSVPVIIFLIDGPAAIIGRW